MEQEEKVGRRKEKGIKELDEQEKGDGWSKGLKKEKKN